MFGIATNWTIKFFPLLLMHWTHLHLIFWSIWISFEGNIILVHCWRQPFWVWPTYLEIVQVSNSSTKTSNLEHYFVIVPVFLLCFNFIVIIKRDRYHDLSVIVSRLWNTSTSVVLVIVRALGSILANLCEILSSIGL